MERKALSKVEEEGGVSPLKTASSPSSNQASWKRRNRVVDKARPAQLRYLQALYTLIEVLRERVRST